MEMERKEVGRERMNQGKGERKAREISRAMERLCIYLHDSTFDFDF